MLRKTLTILIVFVALVQEAALQDVEGDECTDSFTNTRGVCCSADDCSSAQEDLRMSRAPTICSSGNPQIVCCRSGCASGALTATPAPSVGGMGSIRTGGMRRSEQMCAQYNSLPRAKRGYNHNHHDYGGHGHGHYWHGHGSHHWHDHSMYPDYPEHPSYPNHQPHSMYHNYWPGQNYPNHHEHPKFSTSPPMPTYPNNQEQPKFPNSPPGQNYPNHQDQPTFPISPPTPTYPNNQEQPKFPNSPPGQNYPNHQDQPTFPISPPTPTYPNNQERPKFPNSPPGQNYPNHHDQPTFPISPPTPTYPNNQERPKFPNSPPGQNYPNDQVQPPFSNSSPSPTYPEDQEQQTFPNPPLGPTDPNDQVQPTNPDIPPEDTDSSPLPTLEGGPPSVSTSTERTTGVWLAAIGGVDALANEFPHMAALGWPLRTGGLTFKCGGSLISEKFVLTAGHCLALARDTSLASPEPTIVRLGDQNILDNVADGVKPLDVPILKIIRHPNYNSPMKYFDIALLELQSSVPISNHIKPACIWTKPTFDDFSSATVTGWGTTVSGGRDNSEVLQKVDVNIISTEVCQPLLRNSRNRNWLQGFSDHQMCAGVLEGGKDACQGDSGGPLQIRSRENAKQYHIIGVTSFGRECGKPNLPGVYTRVSSFVEWIESVVWP